ncbi:MAG: tetratricopeptide repeat protein [Planctomycetota bacterium]
MLSAWLAASDEVTPAPDKGENDDAAKGIVVKESNASQKDKEKNKARTAKAVRYHIKNLKDPDPSVRQSSCEMLGMIGSPLPVPDLIDVLRPERQEREMVLLAANGALVRITGKNFGAKNYPAWLQWWSANKEEFLKKAEVGPDPKQKIRAEADNTLGLESMKRGELVAAQTQFLDAVNSDPTVPDYRNNLGLALLNQGRYLDAMVYFRETIGLNPDLPQPYMNIGHCYSRMAKTIEAQSWYKKAMALDKEGNLWEPLWLLGKEHMKRGEWSIAFEYLDQSRMRAEKLHLANHLHANLCKDLAITHFGLDQYNSAWKEIKNVETLGFKCDPGFVAKVKKALVDQGVDPDADDKKAREVMRGTDEDEGKK